MNPNNRYPQQGYPQKPNLGNSYPGIPFNNNPYPVLPNQPNQYPNQQPNPNMNYSNPQYNQYGQYQAPQQPSFIQPGQNPNPYNSQFGYQYPPPPQAPNYPGNQFQGPNPMTSILSQMINMYSDALFAKYDRNKSGFLDTREIYPAVCEVYAMGGVPAPDYPLVLSIMRKFDKDGNGLLDRNEFRNLLKMLNGV